MLIPCSAHPGNQTIQTTLLSLQKIEILSPSVIVHASTAYSDVCILVCNDNTKTHHLQQFGEEKHVVIIRSNSNSSHQ